MASFSKALKLQDIEIGGFALEFYNKQPKDYKLDISKVYKPNKCRSTRNADKIINELSAMYQAKPTELVKQRILDEGSFACSVYLHSSKFAPATYISLLLLTFPLLREIYKLLPSFGNEFFTPEILMQKLEYPFDSEETKKDAVYNALRTLAEVYAIKKLKKGLFKRAILPVPDVQGLEALLLTAQELGDGNVKLADTFLQCYSFEITHDFVDYYENIDFSTIIPEEALKEFLASEESYTLQYNNGKWIISKNEFLYQESNLPITAFRRDFYVSLDQLKAAKKKCPK